MNRHVSQSGDDEIGGNVDGIAESEERRQNVCAEAGVTAVGFDPDRIHARKAGVAGVARIGGKTGIGRAIRSQRGQGVAGGGCGDVAAQGDPGFVVGDRRNGQRAVRDVGQSAAIAREWHMPLAGVAELRHPGHIGADGHEVGADAVAGGNGFVVGDERIRVEQGRLRGEVDHAQAARAVRVNFEMVVFDLNAAGVVNLDGGYGGVSRVNQAAIIHGEIDEAVGQDDAGPACADAEKGLGNVALAIAVNVRHGIQEQAATVGVVP